MTKRRIRIFTIIMLIIDFFYFKYVLFPWGTNWFRVLVICFVCIYQGYCLLLANIAASKESDFSTWRKEIDAMIARWEEEKKREEEAAKQDN